MKPYYYAIPAIKEYRCDLSRILSVIARKLGCEEQSVLTNSRKKELVFIRHLFSYVSIVKFQYQPRDVARFLERSHGCVNNSIKVIRDGLRVNGKYRRLIQELNFEFDCTVKEYFDGILAKR